MATKMSIEKLGKFSAHLYKAQELLKDSPQDTGNFAVNTISNLCAGLPLRIAIDMIAGNASHCDSMALLYHAIPGRKEAFAQAAKEFYSAIAVLIEFRMTLEYDFST